MPETPNFSQYRSRTVYTLEPHAQWADEKNGYIPIETIVEKVYGKPYSSLRGCQRNAENLGNDQVVLIELASEDDYLQALFDLDGGKWEDGEVVFEPGVYLGYDRDKGETVVKNGVTEIEYWLSFDVADNPDQADFEYRPEDECADLTGKTFADRFFMDDTFSPSLRLVLADLIRRGELPQADYLFRHWW